jgi:hypothetical protein
MTLGDRNKGFYVEKLPFDAEGEMERETKRQTEE